MWGRTTDPRAPLPRPGRSPWRPIWLLVALGASLLAVSHILDDSDSEPSPQHSGRDVTTETPSGSPAAPATEPLRQTGDPPASVGGPSSPPRDGTALATDPPATQAESTTTLWLQGRVLDVAGQPIENARITLGERTTRSSGLGEFLMPRSVEPLTIEKSGYFPRTLSRDERRELLRNATLGADRLHVVLREGGRVRGRVLDVDGEPVSDARVRFAARQPVSASDPSCQTSPDGSFTGPLLPIGSTHIVVTHEDYLTWSGTLDVPSDRRRAATDDRDGADDSAGDRSGESHSQKPVGASAAAVDARHVAPHEHADLARIVLEPGQAVRVVVESLGGEPLPDASVWVIETRDEAGVESSRPLGHTTDDGSLIARVRPDSQPRVRVRLPGYRQSERELYGDTLHVRLRPAPQVHGIAKDDRTGRYAEILRIGLEMETESGFRRVDDRGVLFHTLETGRFRIGLPPFAGRYRARVEGDAGLSGVSPPFAFDGSTDPPAIEVPLQRRGGLAGRVICEAGAVSGARVILFADNTAALGFLHGLEVPTAPPRRGATTTDASGRFELADLAEGVYRLRVVHPDFAPSYSPPLRLPGESDLVVPLSSGARISGVVYDRQGSPQPDMPLVLVCRDRPFPRHTRSGSDGSYAFEHLSDGAYLLFVADPSTTGDPATRTWSASGASQRFDGTEKHALRVVDGEDVTYNLKLRDLNWGALRGRLTADDAPLAGIELRVRGPLGDTRDDASTPRETTVTTDASGRFRLFGLTPGTYAVTGSYPPIDRTFTVGAGEGEEQRIELQAQAVTLRLEDALRGTPVSGRFRAVVSTASAPGGALSETTLQAQEPDAEVALGRLFPGTYRVLLEGAGYVPLERKFAVASEPVRVPCELRRGVAVELSVIDSGAARGEDVAAGPATVIVLRGNEEIYRHREIVGRQGEISLPELLPGRYELVLQLEERTLRRAFTVDPPPGRSPEDDATVADGATDERTASSSQRESR